MATIYTASVRENPGRDSLVVEFRHPCRLDVSNRPGKKTRKGLGTSDRAKAERLVSQLNEILADESLWSVGARARAESLFDPAVIEIFYAELGPVVRSSRAMRDELLPLPPRDSGYARALMIGVPGAGKSTLIRQLIGSHPTKDRFPSISVNRTTTFPTEVILGGEGTFQAVVTFLSEHETRFEVEESVSRGLLAAIEGEEDRIARELLEPSDMRFRLKYILGELQGGGEDDDPYAEPAQDDEEPRISAEDSKHQQKFLNTTVRRVQALARSCRNEVEAVHGSLDELDGENRNAALDLIQDQCTVSEEYAEIVADVLDELKERFKHIDRGTFDKSTTGWPRSWVFKVDGAARADFLQQVRYFSDISVGQWGRLLTPLVNGIRVAGPFKPIWASSQPRLVLFDSEGLGHKADATADLPDHLVALFDEADSIVLVQSAKNAMEFSSGKALEAIVSAGQTKKTIIVFTHMDVVEGPNLRGRAKQEHAFNNLRNVVENQLGKSLPSDVVRYVCTYLEANVFYLGKLKEAEAVPAYPELRRLVDRVEASAQRPAAAAAFPQYSIDNLVLAIREAAEEFRLPWRSRLGLEPHPQYPSYAWQSIKAMTRRYAEGFDDGYPLRPTSNLLSALSVATSKFLESATGWQGTPSEEEKRDTIDQIKASVAKSLTTLSQRRLRTDPQPQWQGAYSFRGTGSTVDRKLAVESIYARRVPIPRSAGDEISQEFLNEVKNTVLGGIHSVRGSTK